nr:hypothetical protein Iba_chr04eCG18290 [Ipomoea batatas]
MTGIILILVFDSSLRGVNCVISGALIEGVSFARALAVSSGARMSEKGKGKEVETQERVEPKAPAAKPLNCIRAPPTAKPTGIESCKQVVRENAKRFQHRRCCLEFPKSEEQTSHGPTSPIGKDLLCYRQSARRQEKGEQGTPLSKLLLQLRSSKEKQPTLESEVQRDEKVRRLLAAKPRLEEKTTSKN